MGIKEGDYITMSCLSTNEAIYLFIAANLIGAITRPIDPVCSTERVKNTICLTNSKLYITNDFNFIKQKNLFDECSSLENVIALPVDYVLNNVNTKDAKAFKTASKLSRLIIKITKRIKKWTSYEDFLKIKSKNLTEKQLTVPYRKGQIMSILSTSGSTGEPRGVCVTDDNYIISVDKQIASCFKFNEDDDVYNPMPSNSSYFWDDIILAICYHCTTKLNPLFNIEECSKDILNSKASVVLAGPIIIERLINYINEMPEEEKKKISMRHLISGGDILSKDLEERANKVFSQINPDLRVENAYGTSETVGPAFIPNGIMKNESAYSFGSTGVLLPGDVCGIFAFDKENEQRNLNDIDYNKGLLFYQVGEICFSQENQNIFVNYFKNAEATTGAKITHTDGSKWYHTGDLGYIDLQGFQYTISRKNGLIVRQGHKIWSPKIENIVNQFTEVIDCSVIGVPDVQEQEVPVIFIKFQKDMPDEYKDNVINLIKQELDKKLDSFHIPLYFWKVDSIPRNTMMKAKIGELFKLHQELMIDYTQEQTNDTGLKLSKQKR